MSYPLPSKNGKYQNNDKIKISNIDKSLNSIVSYVKHIWKCFFIVDYQQN